MLGTVIAKPLQKPLNIGQSQNILVPTHKSLLSSILWLSFDCYKFIVLVFDV